MGIVEMLLYKDFWEKLQRWLAAKETQLFILYYDLKEIQSFQK